MLEQLKFTEMRLATIDVATGQIHEVDAFPGAKHISPQWSADGGSIYFIANPEGVPDIYRIQVAGWADLAGDRGRHRRRRNHRSLAGALGGLTQRRHRLLHLRGRQLQHLFSAGRHDRFDRDSDAKARGECRGPGALLLPPLRGTGSDITGYLMRPEEGLPPASTQFAERAYKPDLHLSYLGPPTIGVGVNEFGVGAGGSVTAYYSDILGQQNVGFTFQGTGGNGSQNIADQLGGEVFYLNQKRRLNWGADLVHVPYVFGSATFNREPVDVDGSIVVADVYRQFREVQTISDISGLAQYPFSPTRRIEASIGGQRYAYKQEVETFVLIGSNIIDHYTQDLGGSFSINFTKASTAFVGDSSTFGFISPINGTRYRYEVEALRGDLNFETALADWRKYFFFRPVTVAVRGLHYGRYGAGAEDPRLSPLYLGQGSIARGYDPYSINSFECNPEPGSSACPVFDRLVGSKIAAASVEVRAPLLGTAGYGLIDASFLPTEIFAFADVGAAWSKGQDVKIKYATNTTERVPVFSAGIGLRILLAYIPIEVFAAKPFQRPGEDTVYGFNIIPGW